MQNKASLLALFAVILALFVSTFAVQAAAEDKEAYGTGKVYIGISA